MGLHHHHQRARPMAHHHGRRRPLSRLLLALAAALSALSASPTATVAEQLAPRSISSFPGCGGGKGPAFSGALSAGLFDCHIRDQGVPAGEQRLYALTLPSSSASAAPASSTAPSSSPRPFSTLVYLRVHNGEAQMSLYKPGGSDGGAAAGGAPDEAATPTLDAGAASSESFLALGPDAPAGTYVVAVRATRGAPSLDLEVVTTPSGVRLADEDRRALLAVVDECCVGGGTARDDELEATLPFCSVVAPMALSSYSSLARGASSSPVHRAEWRSDLCHTAPNACNAEGKLTRLGLRSAGLRCPGGFPRALGELTALKHADLSGNDFGAQPFNEVERALAGSGSLSSLLVANSNLAGAVTCGAVQMGGGSLRVLDARTNNLDGALPACLLGATGGGGGGKTKGGRGLSELYLADNALSGALPALEGGGAGDGSLVALSLANQRGSGLKKGTAAAATKGSGSSTTTTTTTTPAALLAKHPALRFLDLGGNPSLGPWRLPSDADVALASLSYLDVSATGLEGSLPQRLPQSLWMLDASDNRLSGPLPASLARQPALVSLRLAGNRLDGTLEAFADALLPPPGGAGEGGGNRIMELNVSANPRLRGPVPDALSRLALFDAAAAAAAAAADGNSASATTTTRGGYPRVLALDGTSLTGQFPSWLVTRVPPVRAACACRVAVTVGGPDSRLQCPDEGSARVSDLEWQVASDLSYECWQGRKNVPLVDLLTSPSVTAALAARDRGEAWTIGDGGLPEDPAKRSGAIAGIVIGCVVAASLLAGLAFFFFFGGRRWLKARAAARRGGGGVFRGREAQMAPSAFHDVAKLKNSCGGVGVGIGGGTSGGGGGGGAPALPSMLSTATSLGGCLLEEPQGGRNI